MTHKSLEISNNSVHLPLKKFLKITESIRLNYENDRPLQLCMQLNPFAAAHFFTCVLKHLYESTSHSSAFITIIFRVRKHSVKARICPYSIQKVSHSLTFPQLHHLQPKKCKNIHINEYQKRPIAPSKKSAKRFT